MSERQETRPGAPKLPEQPWAAAADDVAAQLGVTPGEGLDEAEVRRRRKRFGPNRLRETKSRSPWQIFADQFKSIVVGLLFLAAVAALLFHEYIDCCAILAVIGVNAAIGFVMEWRAVRSMQALKRLSRVTCTVRREGALQRIPADQIVPGDILVFEGGDIATADMRLVAASKLAVDESMLTGESVPVSKQCAPVAADVELADRSNMLFKGTAVTRGSGEAVAVATGMQTQLGEISALIETAEDEETPLEKKLDALGRKLVWVTCVVAVLTGVAGVAAGKELLIMVETAVALAVAAIPEGLPIVATIALARGMVHMARRNAIVNRLSAVETLGATKIICTDKTGTLTENRMTVVRYVLAEGAIVLRPADAAGAAFVDADDNPVDAAAHGGLRAALEIGALCNNAMLGTAENAAVGDPMEVALLAAANRAHIRREVLAAAQPEEREEAFDSDIKMMATFHRRDHGLRVAVKGAAEPVLEACTHVRAPGGPQPLDADQRRDWLEANERMAERGLRVLALAEKTVDGLGAAPYENLVLIGLTALVDPPRGDVRAAVERCRAAGITVVMATGDQPATACNIARAVSILDPNEPDEAIRGRDLGDPAQMTQQELERLRATRVFARVSPKQKLSLIAAHRDAGNIVAMTGDGVNDAPALKQADIGVAMGQRGTEVAREAADMVLTDDAFGSIVDAVETGRIIFGNIRTFVLYLMSCNLSEILIIGLASAVNAPLPILPLQILFLNIVTDVFPALALGMGRGSSDVMHRPPRAPSEPVLARRQWIAIAVYSALITLAVLGAFALALWRFKTGPERAVTIAFLVLAFAQLWHVFNMRDHAMGVFLNNVTRNGYVWAAIGICITLLLAAVYLPGLSHVLDLVAPSPAEWALALAMSFVPVVLGQIAGQWLAPETNTR